MAFRMDPILLMATFSIKPAAADHTWKRLYHPKNRPISFRACGIRPTGDLFVASVIPLIGSVVWSFARELLLNSPQRFRTDSRALTWKVVFLTGNGLKPHILLVGAGRLDEAAALM